MREPSPSFWQRRRVFVTGATGLLGSHLVESLLGMDAEVVALVRDAVPRSLLVGSGLVDRITVVRGDITDEPLLRRIREPGAGHSRALLTALMDEWPLWIVRFPVGLYRRMRLD